jgi:hypothetical protein
MGRADDLAIGKRACVCREKRVSEGRVITLEGEVGLACGSLWEPVGACGSLWEPVEACK